MVKIVFPENSLLGAGFRCRVSVLPTNTRISRRQVPCVYNKFINIKLNTKMTRKCFCIQLTNWPLYLIEHWGLSELWLGSSDLIPFVKLNRGSFSLVSLKSKTLTKHYQFSPNKIVSSLFISRSWIFALQTPVKEVDLSLETEFTIRINI